MRRLSPSLVVVALCAAACKPEVGAIELPASELRLAVGEATQIKAAVRDKEGAALRGTLDKPIGIDLSWSSSEPSVALVEPGAVESDAGAQAP